MSSDPHLAALPALRKRAEEEARSCHEAQVAAIKAKHYGYHAQDLIDALPPAWVDVDAHLSLLCDLTRPASRRELAAMVAERIGWDAFDVTRAVESSTAMLAGLYRAAGLPELPRWEPAPTPAEALTLIAISTLTTTD
jgi:hypothetical protein